MGFYPVSYTHLFFQILGNDDALACCKSVSLDDNREGLCLQVFDSFVFEMCIRDRLPTGFLVPRGTLVPSVPLPLSLTWLSHPAALLPRRFSWIPRSYDGPQPLSLIHI